MKTAEQIIGNLLDELKQYASSPEDFELLVTVTDYWDIVREQRERLQVKILMLQEELRIEDENFTTMFE